MADHGDDHVSARWRQKVAGRTLESWRADVERAWETGASYKALLQHLVLSYQQLHRLILDLRKAGADLPPRPHRHVPPPGWKQRLDDLRAEDCK